MGHHLISFSCSAGQIDVDRDYWSGHVMQLKPPGIPHQNHSVSIRLPLANGPKLTGGRGASSRGAASSLFVCTCRRTTCVPTSKTITSALRPLTSSTFI